MSSKLWQALDANGNVIDEWAGPQKASRVGAEWKGTMVDRIEEYRPPQLPTLEERFAALVARVEALENGV